MELQKKTVSGVIWTLGQQFSSQIIYFVVQIILARLLSPSVFGIIAMLQIFLAVGQTLLDSGMSLSLIRTQNVDNRDYSTVFITNLAASLIIYLVVFLFAPVIADFYKIPLLKSVVRVYTISFIIQALVGVQTARLTKEMNFKLQMLMQLPSAVIGGIVGITLAYFHYGVWSLVWLNLVRTFVFMLQHWFYTDWRPAFVIDKEKLRYHFNFGYKLTLSGLLNVVYDNSYNLIIGKVFSATELGYYNQADTFSKFPINNLSTALNKVTYPMFSAIKNDDTKLKIAYKKLLLQVLFWIIPIMLSLMIIAKPLIIMTVGLKWSPAVPYFQILCLSAIIYPLHIYNLNIINVKGRSDLFLRLEVIKKVLGALIIAISLYFNMIGLLIIQVVFSYIVLYINSYYSGKMIHYSFKEQLIDIFPMFLIGVITASVSWSFFYFLSDKYVLPNIVQVLLICGFFFFIYLTICYFNKLSALKDFIKLISGKPLIS